MTISQQRSVGSVWIAALALAQLGVWLGLYAPLKTVMPLLAEQISSDSGTTKEGLLAAATLAGSLVALIANPLAGLLSDETCTRWGARKPWILGGAILASIAIWLLPEARTGGLLLLSWCIAKLALNGCMAALNAAVADRVPGSQQGSIWGWVGLAQPIGLVLGVAISTSILPNLRLTAFFQALLLSACCIPILFLVRMPKTNRHQRVRWNRQFAAFSDSMFKRLWWSRFWLYLGWSMSTVYLLYFLEDRIGLTRGDALRAQTYLLALYATGTVVSAAIAGLASDRCGNRLIFVITGTLGMSVACSLMLISSSVSLALAASLLLGIAYGIYIATNQALVLENLPYPDHNARDLGLFNGANTAPMVLAPALSWLCVVHLGGYTALFGVAAFLIFVSLLPLRGLSRERT